MPDGKLDPEDDGHGQQVGQEVGDDVQVRRRPPDGLAVAVGDLLELEVPEGSQRNARRHADDKDESLVDHDEDEEAFGRAPGPGVVPYPVV